MVVPPVRVEEMRVDRAPVDLRTLRELPAGSRDFEFVYTALSFTAPERVRFKYKLEGFDRDWVDAGARRVALLHEPRPGPYRFRVIAANDDGVWNESGRKRALQAAAALLSDASLFYLLCALGLVFVGAGACDCASARSGRRPPSSRRRSRNAPSSSRTRAPS